MPNRTLISCSLFYFYALSAPAAAEFIVDVASTVSPGPTAERLTYDYEVANSSQNADDGDLDLFFEFVVAVDAAADLTDISAPEGWVALYNAGDLLISWTASDFPFTIAPGESLTFGFASVLMPGDTDYDVSAFNQLEQGGNLAIVSGITQGPVGQRVNPDPTVIPEPSSLVLCGVSALGLIGCARRRRMIAESSRSS